MHVRASECSQALAQEANMYYINTSPSSKYEFTRNNASCCLTPLQPEIHLRIFLPFSCETGMVFLRKHTPVLTVVEAVLL